MCGICGIIGQYQDEEINRMVDSLQHRVPDDKGIFKDTNACLGMTRLSILDTTLKGHQPMRTEDKLIWIVYNGELYNYHENRSFLEKKGIKFFSNSDTEVVLNLYKFYGLDFFKKLKGMYALAIIDKTGGLDNEKLILGRDPFGIKPLLFYEDSYNFIFSSEMKSILQNKKILKEIDFEALRLLLTFGSIPQPKTIIKNVKMLMPGEYLLLNKGKIEINKFFDLSKYNYIEKFNKPYLEILDDFKYLFRDNLNKHLISDVPLGAFLSGGIDSSLLVAYMAKFSNKKIKTYTVGYMRENYSQDESKDAEKIANYIGTEHHNVILHNEDINKHFLSFIKAIDQPSVDGFNSYFVSNFASKYVKVAISGTGGDELFASYPWFLSMLLDDNENKSLFKKNISDFFKNKFFNKFNLFVTRSLIEKSRRYFGFLPKLSRLYQIFNNDSLANILNKDILKLVNLNNEPSADQKDSDILKYSSTINRVSGFNLRGYTQNQLLRDIDAVSMYNSIEVRVPFLDVDILDYVLKIPDEYKINFERLSEIKDPYNTTYRDSGAKKILIDLGKGLLPDNMDNQTKRGFGMPFDYWLKSCLNEVFQDVFSFESINRRNIFNFNELSNIKNQFLSNKISWVFPWIIIIIECWLREFIDN